MRLRNTDSVLVVPSTGIERRRPDSSTRLQGYLQGIWTSVALYDNLKRLLDAISNL